MNTAILPPERVAALLRRPEFAGKPIGQIPPGRVAWLMQQPEYAGRPVPAPARQPAHKVTQPIREEIWRLRGKGHTHAAIGRAVGLSPRTVCEVLQQPAPSEKKAIRRMQAREAAQLRASGHSQSDIGKLLKCSNDKVVRLLRLAETLKETAA